MSTPIDDSPDIPLHDRRHTPSASDFPIPQGQPFNVTKRDKGLISPTQSSFSLLDEESAPHAITTPMTSPEDALVEPLMSKDSGRGTPGDGISASAGHRSPGKKELAKKKSQFYGDVFTYREPNISPRDRVYKDSMITAEVKTNVIIKDEYSFLTDLAQHLSQRYQRPISSISITLDHSACLLFAGSFDSAYIITISALPSQLLPTTNKRNTALIQSFLVSSLAVAADRGLIRFIGIPEEYMGTNGLTVLGQVEKLQKENAKENKMDSIAISSMDSKPHLKKRQHKPPELTLMPKKTQSTPTSRVHSPTLYSPPVPAIPNEKSALDKKAERVQKLGKRRSLLAIFGR